MVEDRAKNGYLRIVRFREKLSLFNKLFDDKCDISEERVQELLEEARKEDSKVVDCRLKVFCNVTFLEISFLVSFGDGYNQC